MKFLTLILTSIILITPAMAQTNYSLDKSNSTMMVKGTSSVHDWESNVESFSGTATVTSAENVIESIGLLKVDVVAESVKSGKRIMDNKTKDALDAKKNPTITFAFTDVEEVTDNTVTVAGKLTLAGVTKDITLTGEYAYNTDGSLWITGSQPVVMSDYGIKPPTAMMGALKTGDEVNVEFNIRFSQN